MFRSIVGLWVLLTAVLVFVGLVHAAPTVRNNDIWIVWGVLNVVAVGVNGLALTGSLPPALTRYGFWHSWMAVFGGGYLVTGLSDWNDPRIRTPERLVYVAAGVASLGVLAVSFRTAALLPYLFLVGGVLHLVPIGFDVGLDAVLLAGRTGG